MKNDNVISLPEVSLHEKYTGIHGWTYHFGINENSTGAIFQRNDCPPQKRQEW
ncbi:MAG: hypothetical protein LBL62_02260 [Planctomycetaceae bacterium]|nr:hypothetical protein [Planctomycetaceae bacterium]